MKFFYSKPSDEAPKLEPDVSVCMSTMDSIVVVKLSDVEKMTDTDELRKLGKQVYNHLLQTFDEEECENANIILDEIDKKLNAQ